MTISLWLPTGIHQFGGWPQIEASHLQKYDQVKLESFPKFGVKIEKMFETTTEYLLFSPTKMVLKSLGMEFP